MQTGLPSIIGDGGVQSPISGVLNHLAMMRMSIQPNKKKRIKNPATTSVNNSNHIFLKYIFVPFITIPIDMWNTPKMTESFILMLFTRVNSFSAKLQAGSNPKGYVHPG